MCAGIQRLVSALLCVYLTHSCLLSLLLGSRWRTPLYSAGLRLRWIVLSWVVLRWILPWILACILVCYILAWGWGCIGLVGILRRLVGRIPTRICIGVRGFVFFFLEVAKHSDFQPCICSSNLLLAIGMHLYTRQSCKLHGNVGDTTLQSGFYLEFWAWGESVNGGIDPSSLPTSAFGLLLATRITGFRSIQTH